MTTHEMINHNWQECEICASSFNQCRDELFARLTNRGLRINPNHPDVLQDMALEQAKTTNHFLCEFIEEPPFDWTLSDLATRTSEIDDFINETVDYDRVSSGTAYFIGCCETPNLMEIEDVLFEDWQITRTFGCAVCNTVQVQRFERVSTVLEFPVND